MKNITSIIVLMTGLMLASASETRAQTILQGKAFVNVNGGGQMHESRDLNKSGSFSVYSQTATWATTGLTTIEGGIFDISAGYKVWGDLGFAVGYANFNSTSTAKGAASIPSPIFFNRPASVVVDEVSTTRKDRNVYLVAMWFFPVTEKIDVAVAIGPSFTRVQQDLLTTGSAEFTQSLTTAALSGKNAVPVVHTESGTAKGVNVGVDGTYLFTKWIGAGAFIRYNGGSVDLPSVSDLKAGGFQMGIGARLRF